MSSHAHCAFEGSVQNLTQRRMSVHHHRELPDRRSCRNCVGAFLNEVCGVYSYDVDAEDLLGVFIKENLRKG